MASRLTTVLIALLAISLLSCSCLGTADIRREQQQTASAMDDEADGLYLALERVAADRGIPLTRRDPIARRLTSDWIDEADQVQRRYYLSVINQAGLLALRVHIDRRRSFVEQGVEHFEDLPRSAETIEEENAMLQEAYRLWQTGAADHDP
ncbi:MAG: hypothetical protein JW797_18025 [Bradymonadales bacterium]|nr:hypothetical protein [Bradymonadales bacterium]